MLEPQLDELAGKMILLSEEMYAQARAGGATPAMAERLAMHAVIREILQTVGMWRTDREDDAQRARRE